MGCAFKGIFVENQIKCQYKQGEHNKQVEIIDCRRSRQLQRLPEHIYFRDVELCGNLKEFAVKAQGQEVFEKLSCRQHTAASEKEEREIKKCERNDPAHRRRNMKAGGTFFFSAADPNDTEIIQYNQQPLHGAPRHIGPCRAVPESAQQKDNKRIEKHPRTPFPAAAKRNIHISDKEPGQRNVPPLPKFLDAAGAVGRIKV